MLKLRVITGTVLFIISCLVLLLSGVPWFLNTVIACLCLQAIMELYRATGAKNNMMFFEFSCLIAVVFSYISVPHYETAITILFIMAIALFVYIMLSIEQITSIHPVVSAMIACFIVCFYKTMSYIRSEIFGLYTLS